MGCSGQPLSTPLEGTFLVFYGRLSGNRRNHLRSVWQTPWLVRHSVVYLVALGGYAVGNRWQNRRTKTLNPSAYQLPSRQLESQQRQIQHFEEL